MLENAFRRFGGVPKSVIPDNLKAAVLQAVWFDLELKLKLLNVREALRHGDTADEALYAARHKGKVEGRSEICPKQQR